MIGMKKWLLLNGVALIYYLDEQKLGEVHLAFVPYRTIYTNFCVETKTPSKGIFAWSFAQFFYPIFLADFHHTQMPMYFFRNTITLAV